MATDKTGPVRFVPPLRSPEATGHAGLNPRKAFDDKLEIDYDVKVTLRDGSYIYVDIYRPEKTVEKLPTIIGWAPYGKQGGMVKKNVLFLNAGILPEWAPSKYGLGEGPDPAYWCQHGYALIFADPRGTWYSPGKFTMRSEQEAEDLYDLIEYAGTQEWSNGKVAINGVSYLSFCQWKVATLNPPHLAAICPWDGLNDLYREMLYHGGIPETKFFPHWSHLIGTGTKGIAEFEDLIGMIPEHPLRDAYWESKDADTSKITVPAYVVAGWSGQGGLHLRGTLEAYKKLNKETTWLDLHGQKIWGNYYNPKNIENQRLFFDWALKGKQNDWLKRPRVVLEVRHNGPHGKHRDENEYPISRTKYTPLYLDTSSGRLSKEALPTENSLSYKAEKPAKGVEADRAVFNHTFDEDTELTGHMKLRLWLETDQSDDADVFVAAQKLDAQGNLVSFTFQTFRDDGPVALGWLRASHRELDPRSTPEQPWHPHTREDRLTPGVAVPLEIELWPSSTHFAAGETLRVVVQGSDIYPKEGHPFGHESLRNVGNHIIYSGGKYDSHILVPVIPN